MYQTLRIYLVNAPMQCQKYKLITRKQEREVMLLSRRSSMINYKTDFLRSNGMSSLYRLNIDPSIYTVMCRWQHLFWSFNFTFPFNLSSSNTYVNPSSNNIILCARIFSTVILLCQKSKRKFSEGDLNASNWKVLVGFHERKTIPRCGATRKV